MTTAWWTSWIGCARVVAPLVATGALVAACPDAREASKAAEAVSRPAPAPRPASPSPAGTDASASRRAPPRAEDRSAYALPVVSQAKLPVYRPKNDLERLGVEAALAALGTLGEGGTVALILQAAPHLMNVSSEEGAVVRQQLEKRYAELDDDALWASVPSPLPSAFAHQPPLLLVAPPRDGATDPETAEVVVFLHGYGGNGKLFAWLLSRALPTRWVVAPSHGLTWRSPDLRYLDEALSTFEEHTGRRPSRYVLVGLSDGGVGSFEVLAARSRRFAALVNIVGVPREAVIDRLPTTTPMLWVNGRRDRFVGATTVDARFQRVKARAPSAAIAWREGGHYFLLDDDAAALIRTRAFLDRVSASAP